MFKLKLINKPKMIKLKCGFSFPNIVLANMQEKEVIPTKEQQEIVPDKNYDGLSKVIVDKIPDEYIIPTGNIEIIENGVYNVREKETATVNIPEPKLGTKNITSNGVYKASDDELDGYSEVTVETSGVDINDYFEHILPTGTNAQNYYDQYYRGSGWFKAIKQYPVPEVGTDMQCAFVCWPFGDLPLVDTSKVTEAYQAFAYITLPTKFPQYDFSSLKDSRGMFTQVTGITELPLLNFSSVDDAREMFSSSKSFVDLDGFIFGQTVKKSTATNDSRYTLQLSNNKNLTEQSIINVFTYLDDIATRGCNSQRINIGSTNLAKLVSEEGQQALSSATEKGWSIS